MMINDQERRAVAKRLRALDVHEWYDGMDEVDSLEEAIGCSISQDWQDMVWWHRLADLIDRPTCHVVKFERGGFISDGVAHRFFELRCSNCGEEPWSDVESVTRFCPCCGAEVVA